MADVAEQRREARRRKILQNSENRMNRLLGKQTSDEKELDSPVSTDESVRTTPSPTENDSALLNEQPHYKVTDSSSERISYSTNATIQPRPPLRGSTTTTTTTTTTHTVRSTSSGQPQERKHTIEETKNLLQILENMRLTSCVVVAVFTRWVLSSGYGIFYFQTIFLPFILLEIGLYSFHFTYMKDMPLPHGNSMMSGALMLCGIKQELVGVYNLAMGYVTAVTEDFALFLFTFLICNAVMT